MEYPKGSIKSIPELMNFKGKTIYSYSRMHSVWNESFVFDGVIDSGRFIKGNARRDILSLLDHHVLPQRKNYNDWFLFGNEEDAKAYLKGE